MKRILFSTLLLCLLTTAMSAQRGSKANERKFNGISKNLPTLIKGYLNNKSQQNCTNLNNLINVTRQAIIAAPTDKKFDAPVDALRKALVPISKKPNYGCDPKQDQPAGGMAKACTCAKAKRDYDAFFKEMKWSKN